MLQKHEGRKKLMFKKTFKGGVHPDDGKRYAKDASYRAYLPQGELVFPMSQHIGKPAKAAMKEGYRSGVYSSYSKDVVRPSAEECVRNPRARSTKMRWAIRAEA